MLIYLRLEYKASIWLWPVGVLLPLLYIYIYFVNRFYADMAINVYYLAASIYGWMRWKKHSGSGNGLGIRFTPPRIWIGVSAVFTALFAALVTILLRTDDVAPWGDAFTTALSIIGMWMLARKYIEQWGVWLVVNVVSAMLYFSKGMMPTGIVYTVYSIVPIFGYIKWKRLMKN